MDNCVNGSPEHLACLVENIGDDIQNIPAQFQRTLQPSYGLVLFSRCPAHRHADEYKSLLSPKGKVCFIDLTYETLFELLSRYFTTAKQKEWIKYLYQRYVNI